jgi:hypothetical protein
MMSEYMIGYEMPPQRDYENEYWEAQAHINEVYTENKGLRVGIQDAMNNIGVPNAGYPSPVAEAYEILDALKEEEDAVDA